MPKWAEWSPAHAPHVKGRYTERTFDEDGLPEEQSVEARCETCKAEWKGKCLTGNVRGHIAKFGVVHAHRDPLEAPRIVRPGSRRGTILRDG